MLCSGLELLRDSQIWCHSRWPSQSLPHNTNCSQLRVNNTSTPLYGKGCVYLTPSSRFMEWDKKHKYLSFTHIWPCIYLLEKLQVSGYFLQSLCREENREKSVLLEVRISGLTLHRPYSSYLNLVHFLSNLRICFLLKISSVSLFYLLWSRAILNVIINVIFFCVCNWMAIYTQAKLVHILSMRQIVRAWK